MENNQKFHVWFWLNHNRHKNGLSKLFIRIVVDSVRAEIASTHNIKKEYWDVAKGRMKASAENSVLVNGWIDHTSNTIKKLFLAFATDGKRITSKELKQLFLGKGPKSKTLLEAFDYHNLKMSDMVKAGKVVPKTLLRYKITRDKVEAFLKHQYRACDKSLPELRLAFVTEFEHYLLTVDKLQSNTAYKYIKNLKKITTMAVGLEWIPSNPFTNFRCSYTNPEREILTQEELNTIIKKDLDIVRLSEVRDVFIFCCYTGFAYADVYNFRQNAVMLGLDGNYWLSTNRQKTGTKEKVPLLPIALDIIERYKDHKYCVEHDKLLPVNSNQRYNSYLKELADICGIKKHLTTHIARHTFATTVTLANGVPIETVSAMLGHTNIKTTQIYAKVVEKKMSEDMELLRSKLFSGKINKKKLG